MEGFGRFLLAVFVIGGFGAMVFGIGNLAENTSQRAQEVQLAEISAEEAKSFEVQAIEEQAGVAKAGFAALVAVAASGDAAQASMVRSFASTWWAIGLTVVAFAFIVYFIKGSGNKHGENSQHYISSDSYTDSYKNK